MATGLMLDRPSRKGYGKVMLTPPERNSCHIVRTAVRTIPDGVYEAGSFMDDDGVALGEHIPTRVRVGVRREEITLLSIRAETISRRMPSDIRRPKGYGHRGGVQ